MAQGLNRDGKGLRVLIVEDDSESIELLRLLFSRRRYEVVGFATDGEEALKKYKKLKPDIVTLDILLPSVDGRVCAKKILEFNPCAAIVVVSVLGHEELESLKELGVKAFIKKPIDIEELFNIIKNLSVSVPTEEKEARMEAVEITRKLNEDITSSTLFIEVLRHDILNPIGHIKNFVELMLDDAPEAMRPQLETIKRNADKLIELVDDASKLSKIEKLKGLDLKPLDVSGLIEDSLDRLEPSIEKKGIIIENNAKGKISIDANILLGDVFYNLLSNAIKYSPSGGKVTIDVEDEKDRLAVLFKDRGSGVMDEYKKAIFERFERSQKKGVKGTGIGLAIVKRIVELHDGVVWVDDSPEGGSIFGVRIPKSDSSGQV
ncbi:MAG: ATP-binding protein [Candidatus Hydrothermarchaeales archaeon]